MLYARARRMYSVTDYGRMLADRARVDAYLHALAAAVRPGHVVVDLGAGTGFFSLEACRLGASKVYAIETNEAIALLPSIARRMGYSDRIEILQRPSAEVVLPRAADVLVADLRGVVPLFQSNFATMADARARLISPAGRMIPERDRLVAGLVHAPDLYGRLVEGWLGHGFDMHEAHDACLNTFHTDRDHPLGADSLVTSSGTWAELVYGIEPPELVRGTLELTASRSEVAHGIALWFETVLLEGIGFSSASSQRVYGRGFLPLERPVTVEAGDRVELELGARRGMGDHIWFWSTRIQRGDRTFASFRQSTFLGSVATRQTIAKELAGYLPRTTAQGAFVANVLRQMNGEATVEEVADAVLPAHPGLFPTRAEAVAQIMKIVREYG